MLRQIITGSQNKFSLEDRILNAVLFMAMIIGMLSFIGDLIQEFSAAYYLFSLSMTIAFGILYFLGRKMPNHKKLIWPFIIIDVLPAIYVWFNLDGISGPSLLFILSLILVVPVITKGTERFISILIVLLVPTVLFFIEINNFELITDYEDNKTEIIDTFISFLFIAIGYIIIIMLIIDAYDDQRKKIESLNNTKDKFFSIIAHDLKGPLGSLMRLGELIMDQQDHIDETSRREILFSIYKSSKATYNLADNLLQWARSESGHLEINPVNISLKQIATENLEILAEKIKNKSINVQLNYNCDPLIKADREMINTVVRNLISNAVKFTNNNGDIEIITTCNEDKQRINLYVRDNGIGIKKEVVNKLFNLDSNYSAVGTNNEMGTGLGLKLCKEFVERNNGEISVESEEMKGTTFLVSFPC